MLLNGFEMSHELWNPFYSHTRACGAQSASPISQPFPRNQFPEISFESPEDPCGSGICVHARAWTAVRVRVHTEIYTAQVRCMDRHIRGSEQR